MPKIIAVCKDSEHNFSKIAYPSIYLLEGLGVEGDAHSGEKVKHPYLAKKDPDQPNLRQVHLFNQEMINKLKDKGFDLEPGSIGENITTADLDILNLPLHTVLKLGANAEIKITGLRTPCIQLDKFRKGLTKALVSKGDKGTKHFQSGIMAIVIRSGQVNKGDLIEIRLPPEPHQKLPAL